MNNPTLNKSIQSNFDLPIKEEATVQEVENILAAYINTLIQKDFDRLIFLLYKIDVSEKKLKQILKEQPQKNAGKIIARLIMERQQQKIISREKFSKKNELGEEEKW
jgi:hypothetical protein